MRCWLRGSFANPFANSFTSAGQMIYRYRRPVHSQVLAPLRDDGPVPLRTIPDPGRKPRRRWPRHCLGSARRHSDRGAAVACASDGRRHHTSSTGSVGVIAARDLGQTLCRSELHWQHNARLLWEPVDLVYVKEVPRRSHRSEARRITCVPSSNLRRRCVAFAVASCGSSSFSRLPAL